MIASLFDTHCHLGGTELESKAEEYFKSALESDVKGFGLISADPESLRIVAKQKIEFKKNFPEATVVATAGIHPHDSEKITDTHWKLVEENAEAAEALGETGLDFFYNHSDKESQVKYFLKHIDLACALSRPLVIHCRNARKEVGDLLFSHKQLDKHPRPGILHCFTEDLEFAEALVKRRFKISFSGIMTFKNAENLRQIAAKLPLESILIETDAPWLAPVPMRGKLNEPKFVNHVFDCLCSLRPETKVEIRNQLWQNSLEVFGLAE